MRGKSIRLLLATTVLLSGAALAQSTTKRVQCWTDDQGRRACGDQVPAQYVKQERQLLDTQGRVVQTRPRERSAAELQAEQAAAQQLEQRRQQERKARDYDRFLLDTFSSVGELEKARDERLQIVSGRRQLLDKTIADNTAAVARQQQRVAGASHGGKTPPAAETRKLDELQAALQANMAAGRQLDQEKQQIGEQYTADITRYRLLRPE